MLRGRIDGMLFERTALSRKPEELARQELARLRREDQLSPDLVFRDPYFLDFLGLADTYSEKDLEAAGRLNERALGAGEAPDRFGRQRGGMQGVGQAASMRLGNALEGARRGDGPGGSLSDVHAGALDAVLGSDRP